MFSALQSRYNRLVGRVSWLWLQVWLLTLLAVVQLVVFQVVVPPWQHFDEPAHFRHAWSLVNLVPTQQAAVFTPLDPVMVRETLGSMVENAFYRELTAPNYLRTHGLDTLGHSQSVEFRMYYDWVGWPLRIFQQADITTQLLAGRAVTGIFLLIVVWSSIGLMRSLTRPGNRLRWLVPLCVVLVAPVADLATAVNNDIVAVAGFSLFLWGAVHGLSRRMTLLHTLWIMAALAFTVAAKQALLFVLPLAPLAVVMGLWNNLGMRWRWLWLVSVLVAVVLAVLTLRLDQAAFWVTRWLNDTPGRVVHEHAVHGDYAIPAVVSSEPIYQRLPDDWVVQHPEFLLNFGAWVWADEPVEIPLLGFAFVAEDANFMYNEVLGSEEPVRVTQEPQFVTRKFWVPREAVILYVFLWPYTLVAQESLNQVYYDGLVLMEGVVDTDQVPVYTTSDGRYVQWGDRSAENLVRNPSAERAWPAFLKQIDLAVQEVAEWHPSAVLHRILDLRWSGHILWVQQPRFMLLNLFNRLAWGGVNLPGGLWGPLTLGLFALGIVGSGVHVRSLLQDPASENRDRGLLTAYGFLAISLVLIWIGADLWIARFMWMDDLHLSDTRYTFPACIITVGIMAGGIQALGNRAGRWRDAATTLVAVLFLAFNVAAVVAYVDTFRGLI